MGDNAVDGEAELIQLRKDYGELREKNRKLKAEAEKYQVIVGNATSYRFADDDQNNPVHFNDDIKNLNGRISKFITNLKNNVEIHSNKISELLRDYKCNKETIKDMQLVKDVLRRLVIETVINEFDKFCKSENSCLETEIMNDLKLLDKLNTLTSSRSGNDIMKSTLIKIRQQIYAILGSLAFANTADEKEHDHPFINNCKTQLINKINQYRTITDESKRKETERQVSAIVRDVISIFYFRRYAQEPIVSYVWVKNDEPIDSLTMTGTWNKDDEIDNLVVQFCSFPLFGVELEDQDKRQIYTPACVIAKEDTPETIRQRA
ncbi:22216_t:CDS:1, partial [Dentiscutata erythropus]